MQVDGLRAGERFRTLSSSMEVTSEDQRYGRVVDAHTGFPVADATIETWTEEITWPGLVLVGQARTAEDGGFRVPVRQEGVAAELRAEKVLVRARGYLTFPGTVPDLDLIRLMPKPEWTWRVQVLDLEDRPIAGARITTTYSCAHDVPAFDVTTGAEGVAELFEYGLQDHPGELRVRAPGFAARKYVDWSEVPADPANGLPAIVRLARQQGLRARVLERGGEPLVEQKLYLIDGDGHHVPTTDEQGGFAIDAAYDGSEVTIQVLAASGKEHVAATTLPEDREVALRIGAADWPAGTPVGTIEMSSLEGDLDVTFFHAQGWMLSTRVRENEPREVEFPAGQVLYLSGERFGGWEPQRLEFELVANETRELLISSLREPELEILVPPGEAHRFVVQAGPRSVELEPQEGRVTTFVPRGEQITLLSEGRRTRRLVLPPLAADSTADLRPASCVVPATRAQLADETPRELLEVEVLGGEGRLAATGPGGPAVERTAPDTFTVEAPLGYPMLLRYVADGFAECWASTTTARGRVALRPTPLASLKIENDTGRELTVVGPEADRLEGLHPGPLSLFLVLDDGRRGLLSLDLAPGEGRTLRLFD